MDRKFSRKNLHRSQCRQPIFSHWHKRKPYLRRQFCLRRRLQRRNCLCKIARRFLQTHWQQRKIHKRQIFSWLRNFSQKLCNSKRQKRLVSHRQTRKWTLQWTLFDSWTILQRLCFGDQTWQRQTNNWRKRERSNWSLKHKQHDKWQRMVCRHRWKTESHSH